MKKIIKFALVMFLSMTFLVACSSSDTSGGEVIEDAQDEVIEEVDETQVYAIVQLSVNPTLAFNVNWYKKVVSVEPVNTDAEILDTTDYVGMDVDEAIEASVEQMEELEIINLSDLEADYALITSAITDDASETYRAELQEKIQARIDYTGPLSSMNVAQMEIDMATQDAADKAMISAIDYVIDMDTSHEDGEYFNIARIFQEESLTEQLMATHSLSITEESLENMRGNIETALADLESQGYEVEYIRQMMNEGEDTVNMLQTVQSEIIDFRQVKEEEKKAAEEAAAKAAEGISVNNVSISKSGMPTVFNITVDADEAVSVYVLVEADNVYASNSYSASQVINGQSPAAGQNGYIVIHEVFSHSGSGSQSFTLNMANYMDNDGGDAQPDDGNGPPEGESGGVPVALVVCKDADGNVTEITAQ